MPEMVLKLEALAAAARAGGHTVQLAVDGGVDERTAPICVAAGARFLVAGSSVFGPRRSVAEGIDAIRSALGRLGR
jgi:ribulose-phosphate 3-epimerase